MQEDHWQKIRKDFVRASNSTIMSSPNTGSPPVSAGLSPVVKADDADTDASRLNPRDSRNEDGPHGPFSAVTETASRTQMSRPTRVQKRPPPVQHALQGVLDAPTPPVPPATEPPTSPLLPVPRLPPVTAGLGRPVTRQSSEPLGIENPTLRDPAGTAALRRRHAEGCPIPAVGAAAVPTAARPAPHNETAAPQQVDIGAA